ncbi:hypothetical protein BTR23_06720 [Alkalihalophilus pseudofirmus]|uniref:hypothetical protein n=1 Tax=Alkalihalobacterium alkalinitrilicum TaxID=427920 RepID=UPI00094C62C4|nr:hypothetical protein [Alkalihalobacterium alkalinitrilicum]OLO40187.1 hypothetical protein BTR23_06720 [Alkalihalophilus pseudofirmus]
MLLFVGFGRLTKGLLPFINSKEAIYVFHTREKKKEEYQKLNVNLAKPTQFSNATHVFLALPASEYKHFFTTYGQYFQKDTIFFHMATALLQHEVQQSIPYGTIVPCKCIGQADQMAVEQKGLIIVPREFSAERSWLQSFFTKEMTVLEGKEEDVILINQLATKAALELAMSLKKELYQKGLNEKWIDHSLEVTVRGVIKSYCHGKLGGFGRNLLVEIEKQNEVSDNENR